jgi:hypothetical protein
MMERKCIYRCIGAMMAVMIMILVGLYARHRQKRGVEGERFGSIVSVGLYDREPACDFAASVSWKDDGEGSAAWNVDDRKEFEESVVYRWLSREDNDASRRPEECGTGAQGFREVLRRVEKLPEGSAVKVYPNYCVYPLERTGYIVRWFPFGDEGVGRLAEIGRRRGIRFVFSIWDDKGELDEVIARDLDELGMRHPVYRRKDPSGE